MIKSRRNRRPGTFLGSNSPVTNSRVNRVGRNDSVTPSDGPVTAKKNTRSRVSVRRRGHGTMACHTIGRAKTRGSILPQQGHGAMACHTSTTNRSGWTVPDVIEEMKTRTKRYEERAKKKMSPQTWPLNKGPLPIGVMDKYLFRC